MGREIYTALSGAEAAWRQVEFISNNLANVSTAGFRAAHVEFALDGDGGLGNRFATVGEVRFDNSDGPLVRDDVPSHLALRGDAFFSLEDGSFTRDGAFRIDPDGRLTTAQGVGVLGESGVIQLDPSESFSVGSDGVIVGERSGEVGQLRLSTVTSPAPLGGSRWSGTGAAATGASVVQGALEGSNVDPLHGMAELIESSRFFESQQKVMQASDEMRERLNRVGGG